MTPTAWIILTLVVSTSAEVTEFTLVSDHQGLCEVCHCQPDVVKCQDFDKISLEYLPREAKTIVISQGHALTLKRGSIRANYDLQLVVQNVTKVVLDEKSITLAGEEVEVRVKISGGHSLEIGSRAVSASRGSVFFSVEGVEDVSVSRQAFDVLDKVHFRQIRRLTLAPTAFKPNVNLGFNPKLWVLLEDVGSIPILPSNVFTSSKNLSLIRCDVKAVSANAFAGMNIEFVLFSECVIDRIHKNAFPEISLVGKLIFRRCNLSSVAEHAVKSAISSLEVRSSEVASMSGEAFSSQVAEVNFKDNTLKTLANRSLVLQLWNQFRMVGNQINFLDGDALAGVSNPHEVDGKINFVFSRNNISYANQGGLKLNLPFEDTTSFHPVIENNVFAKKCDCETESWLDFVTGSYGQSSGELAAMVKNTSFCTLSIPHRKCFGGKETTQVTTFTRNICEVAPGEEACATQWYEELWIVFKEKLATNDTRGILLVILLFAITASLLISIYTLIRWIIYTIQMRRKVKNVDEWNFTKIEERHSEFQDTSSPIDHYEKLPLTREEEEEEDISHEVKSVKSQSECKSPTHDQETSSLIENEARPGAEANRASIGAPPKMTFYDEMIDLLKEKLDDPENYSTVADLKPTCFYEDPFEVKSKEDKK